VSQNAYSTTNLSNPGAPGGGGPGTDSGAAEIGNGAVGAVRIIWGFNRAFPSTNTADIT
jgi:hypothetical protein